MGKLLYTWQRGDDCFIPYYFGAFLLRRSFVFPFFLLRKIIPLFSYSKT